MAWERRERGGLYYTRSRRENGRVVREYVGAGPLAEAVATLDALDRAERELAAFEWRTERESLEASAVAVRDLSRQVDAAVAAELEAHGYHCHRGDWRRAR